MSITVDHHSSSSAGVVSAVAFKLQKQVLLRLAFPATSAALTAGAIPEEAEEDTNGDGHNGQGLASVVML